MLFKIRLPIMYNTRESIEYEEEMKKQKEIINDDISTYCDDIDKMCIKETTIFTNGDICITPYHLDKYLEGTEYSKVVIPGEEYWIVPLSYKETVNMIKNQLIPLTY